jgi:hypothetical protein
MSNKYGNDWLRERAQESKDLLDQLPSSLRQGFVLASATLPLTPTLTPQPQESLGGKTTPTEK